MTEPRWLHSEFDLPLSQREVDFVIPRLDSDLPLAIDPFLLFKSKRPDLQAAHAELIGMFHAAFDLFRRGDEGAARELLRFPEVAEVRFGYANESIQGSGVGEVLSGLTIEVLRRSPALLERGIRHVEELQLFSVGIGPDRISDAVAGVLKRFLIEYTGRQAAQWGIPVQQDVPISHIWDGEGRAWTDEYVSLPIDPVSGVAVLLVPRWIVRRLPWINFPDFSRVELTRFLKSSGRTRGTAKPDAVAITQHDVRLVDAYVDRKEREAAQAQPDPPPLLPGSPYPAGDDLLAAIEALPIGKASAYEYQRLVLSLLNSLFEPELVDGVAQVRTATGVEIRDLVFTNNSDRAFLRFLQTEHANLLVVFDCKNVRELAAADVNQLANYLGDPMGRCGFIVMRHPPSSSELKKARATYNKGSPRKVVLFISDHDLRTMVELKRAGTRHPVDHLQRIYREFVQSIE